MRLLGLNRRRSQTLLLLVGQLVLIAYVFQIAAFDHWDLDVGKDVAGFTGSDAHAAVHSNHCHGAAASCAEAGAGFAQFSADEAFRLPAQPSPMAISVDFDTAPLSQAFVATIAEPPRSRL